MLICLEIPDSLPSFSFDVSQEKILLEENTRLREKVIVLYMLYELSDPTLSIITSSDFEECITVFGIA
jgi:hypothetical protein